MSRVTEGCQESLQVKAGPGLVPVGCSSTNSSDYGLGVGRLIAAPNILVGGRPGPVSSGCKSQDGVWAERMGEAGATSSPTANMGRAGVQDGEQGHAGAQVRRTVTFFHLLILRL